MILDVNEAVQVLMYRLADNYIEGVVAIGIFIEVVYLIFSIRLLFTTRDVKMNVYGLAFIPGVNIGVWIVKCLKMRRLKNIAEYKSYDDLF